MGTVFAVLDPHPPVGLPVTHTFPLHTHTHTHTHTQRPITLALRQGLLGVEGWLGRRVQVLLVAAAALLSGSIKGNYCWW